MRRDRREFDAFVDEVGGALLHTADLLTGDPRRAERRVRRALARTCLHWRRAADADPMRLAYRALLAGYLDPWRPRPWRRRPSSGPDDARAATLCALDRLSRVERAVAVLRWYALLDAFDTADALGLPVDAVLAAEERAAPVLGRAPRPGGSAPGPATVVWQADLAAPRADPGRGMPPGAP
jgi:DNA-directed RNA polymerase specialized sigma24 family protein